MGDEDAEESYLASQPLRRGFWPPQTQTQRRAATLTFRSPCNAAVYRQSSFISEHSSSVPRVLIVGLQHALVAFATIMIVPTRLASVGRFEAQAAQAIRCYALIVSACASILQCSRVTVVTLSDVFKPTESSFAIQRDGLHSWQDSRAVCKTDADCSSAWADSTGYSMAGVTNVGQCSAETSRCKFSGEEVYMQVVGTSMVAALVPFLLGLISCAAMRAILRARIIGVLVVLVSVAMLSTSVQLWAGGIFCDPSLRGRGAMLDLSARLSPFDLQCSGNGSFAASNLPYGSPQYLGLGLMAFLTLLSIHIFACPLLREGALVIALFATWLVVFLSPVSPPPAVVATPAVSAVPPSASTSAVKGALYPGAYGVSGPPAVEAAGWGNFAFLDARFLPTAMSFKASLLPPLLMVAVINCLRVVGDVSAIAEASRCPQRVGVVMQHAFFVTLRGGLFSTGMGCLISGLCGFLPLATLSQNSFTVALTRISCPRVGYAACAWLLFLGCIPKFGASIAAIPDCVFGGLVAVLFGGQLVSGLRLVVLECLRSHRSRVILAAALASGLGVALVPTSITAQLGRRLAVYGISPVMIEAMLLFLSTPYFIGTLVGLLTGALLPFEDDMSLPLLLEHWEQLSVENQAEVSERLETGNAGDNAAKTFGDEVGHYRGAGIECGLAVGATAQAPEELSNASSQTDLPTAGGTLMRVEEISAGTNVNGQGNATPEREVGLVVEPYIQAASNSSPAQSGIRVFGNGASSVSFLHNENYPPAVIPEQQQHLEDEPAAASPANGSNGSSPWVVANPTSAPARDAADHARALQVERLSMAPDQKVKAAAKAVPSSNEQQVPEQQQILPISIAKTPLSASRAHDMMAMSPESIGTSAENSIMSPLHHSQHSQQPTLYSQRNPFATPHRDTFGSPMQIEESPPIDPHMNLSNGSSLFTNPLSPGWGMCPSCDNPVKIEWGSCPKCGAEVGGDEHDNTYSTDTDLRR